MTFIYLFILIGSFMRMMSLVNFEFEVYKLKIYTFLCSLGSISLSNCKFVIKSILTMSY